MILEIHNPAFPATLRTVFMIYAAFWITVLVILLLGLTTTLYSFYYGATREKEAWELYAEEAERQAKMARRGR